MKLRALLLLSATALVAVAAFGAGLGDEGLLTHDMRTRTDAMSVSTPTAAAANPAPTATLTALPWTRQVTCTGAVTLTGTATNTTSVAWVASPDGASGSCTGTSSWSCAVSVSPNAAGEGVETITVTATGTSGTDTETIDVGFYVAGAHSCFLAQNFDGLFNAGVADSTSITTWENLGSSALDMTQATVGLKPTYRTGIVGGQPVARCDGSDRIAAATNTDWTFLNDNTVDYTIDVSYRVSAANPDALQGIAATASNLASTASRGVSVCHDDRSASTREDRALWTVSSGSVNNIVALSSDDAVTAQNMHIVQLQLDDDGGAGVDGSQFADGSAAGTAVRSGSYSTSAPIGPLTLCAGTGGLSPFAGDVWRLIIYQSALTSTQRGINKAVDEWAFATGYPVTVALNLQAPQDRWLMVGDSLTAGSSGITPWSSKLDDETEFNIKNVAVGGTTTTQILGQWRTNNSPAPTRIFVLGGINDIASGTSAATAFGNLSTIYSEAQALNVEVVAIVTPPAANRSGWTGAKQTELEALRTSIIGAADADIVVDLYSVMGEPGALDELAAIYDVGDGLHPSDLGSTKMKAEVRSAIGL